MPNLNMLATVIERSRFARNDAAVAHAWPPSLRRRTTFVDRGTGLPEPGEQPAKIVNDLVHGVAPYTILAEFNWIDRPLLDAGAATLDENPPRLAGPSASAGWTSGVPRGPLSR